MKRQMIQFFILLISILVPFIAPGEPQAGHFYEGKKVTMVLGFGAGGSNDRMARLLAKYLPKYIPGKPTFLIENIPGAASMIAANQVYNLSKADGLTIGTFDRGLLFAQLLKAGGVKFDLTKFSWIGSVSDEPTVLVVRSTLPHKTFDEMRKSKEVFHMGVTGSGTFDYHFLTLLKEYVGIESKFVVYPTSGEIYLAIERKEVDGRVGSYSSVLPFIERGLIRPLLRGRVSDPRIEKLPVDESYAADPKGKTIMAIRSAADQIARPYVAPPGTPAEAVTTLRDAFSKVTKDPEAKAEADKSMLTFEYLPASECLNVINSIFTQPADIVKEFARHITF